MTLHITLCKYSVPWQIYTYEYNPVRSQLTFPSDTSPWSGLAIRLALANEWKQKRGDQESLTLHQPLIFPLCLPGEGSAPEASFPSAWILKHRRHVDHGISTKLEIQKGEA